MRNPHRLIEVFEKVNKVKLAENSAILQGNQKAIVDDILSLNEDLNSILSKIANYGKKGMLTLAIILAVANSVQASQVKDVIKTGIEYTKDGQDFYSACVGYVSKLGEKETTDVARKAALKEARIYFENLRDGVAPGQLSNAGKFTVDFVIQQVGKSNPQNVQVLIDSGRHVQTIQ